jgi:hypothetical protein
MGDRPWTNPAVTLTVRRVTTLRHVVTIAGDAIWVLMALRVAWLLPDWLGKWQRLLHRRRISRP